jgi:hypothetical protein
MIFDAQLHIIGISCMLTHAKVENILKCSLNLIPSVKIQIMGGKVCLTCKGKTLLGDVNKRLIITSSKLSHQ